MNKKIPLRKCLGCSEMKPKKELIRIVKNKENEIFIDKTGKANGRGTYVCSNECILKVIKKRLLDKAFSEKIDEELYRKLESEINEDDE